MEGVTGIGRLAIDGINRRMYWTLYSGGGGIEVATLDGLNRTVLINTGLHRPQGIAVDPIAGYVAWLFYYKAITDTLIHGVSKKPEQIRNFRIILRDMKN